MITPNGNIELNEDGMTSVRWGCRFVCGGLLALILGSTTLVAQTKGIDVVPSGQQSATQKRVALVIGNAAYKTAPLRNPANDADAMAQALHHLGFTVTVLKNANLRRMNEAIDKFGQALLAGGWGLFYYSGHGVQLDGINYLIPVDATLASGSDVKHRAVAADLVLGKMNDAKNQFNIVILDACRDNPFVGRFKSLSRGLAVVQAPRESDTLIAYATAPGDIADDGTGPNSPYTAALVHHIGAQDLKVLDVFTRVTADVRDKTKGQQTPWQHGSLSKDYCFVRCHEDGRGVLRVFANASRTHITINGAPRGAVSPGEPLEIKDVPVGIAFVQATADGFKSESRSARVESGRLAEISFELEPTESPPPPPTHRDRTWAYVSAGGLGIVAAWQYSVALDLNAKASDTARSDTSKSRAYENDRDAAAQIALLATIGAVGLLGWTWWDQQLVMEPGWRIAPLVSARVREAHAGVMVQYHW